MNVTDLASLAAYGAAGGAAFVLPGLFERLEFFQALAPSGKQLTVGLSALLITLLAVAVQSLMIQYPLVSAAVDPYIKAGLITINILVTQYRHGAAKAALLRAARGEA